jgi:arylsulfatase A-like enzyme
MLLGEALLIGVVGWGAAWFRTAWLRVPLVTALAMVVSTGWVGFASSSRFPNLEAAKLFLMTPALLTAHLQHLSANFLPVLCAGAVLLVLSTEVIVRRAEGWRHRSAPAVTGLCLVWALLLPVTWVLHGNSIKRIGTIYDPRTGVEFAFQDYRRELSRGGSGPLTTLALSLHERLTAPAMLASKPAWPTISAARSPGATTLLGTPAHRWNVVVVIVESLRDDVLDQSAGGIVMPAVLEIGRTGRRYTDTYTTATQTNLASVVPLSGAWPLRQTSVGAYPVEVSYPKALVYDLLRPHGWRTAVFSSQNEDWWGMRRFLDSPRLDTLHDSRADPDGTFVPADDIGFARFVAADRHAGKVDDAATVTHAIEWIGKDATTPFFVSLNLQASHVPYSTPGMEASQKGGSRPSFRILFGRYPIDSSAAVIAQYHRALRYVDDQVRRLRDALVTSGRWDSTIVVITGDHGQAFFEHGVAAHANGLWQEQVRVPLIIRAPSLAPGLDATAASHVDVAPTIARLLGLPDQPAWQGQSLTDEVREAPARFFMVQSPLADGVGAVAGDWKVVRNLASNEVRFTNLRTDPGERHQADPAGDPAAGRLLEQLDSWRAVQLAYYQSPRQMATTFPPRLLQTISREADTAGGSARAPGALARSP